MSGESQYTLSELAEKVIRNAWGELTAEVVSYAKAAGWRDNPADEAREQQIRARLAHEATGHAGADVSPQDVLWLVDRIEKKKSDGTVSALLHSEISEGYEGMRAKLKPEHVRELPDNTTMRLDTGDGHQVMEPIRGYNASKKIGPAFNVVEEEWADEIIRIVDEADRLGLDVIGAVFAKAKFNRQRPFRHGGKRE